MNKNIVHVAYLAAFMLFDSSLHCQTSPLSSVQNHRVRQKRPIKLGTSGGDVKARCQNVCSSGTLGALVKERNGKMYILSNAHVLVANPIAKDKKGEIDNPINQPGNIDVKCKKKSADYVARLSNWIQPRKNKFTLADAAIAQIIKGKVNKSGEILGIGKISRRTKDAFIKQKVKKSGRTSGVTKSRVVAVEGVVRIEVENECETKSFETFFENLVVVEDKDFLKPGDSGSLLVENKEHHPRPIGLLFAGTDEGIAFASPIRPILDHFGVEMIGADDFSEAIALDEEHSQQIANLETVKMIKKANHSLLMQVPGATGHAIGLSVDGITHTILLFVLENTQEVQRSAPKELDGIAVEIVEIGKVKLL